MSSGKPGPTISPETNSAAGGHPGGMTEYNKFLEANRGKYSGPNWREKANADFAKMQAEKAAVAAAERAAQRPPRAKGTHLDDAPVLRDSHGQTYRLLKDPQGREVKIYGQGERSSSKTLGHAEAMNNQVERMVESGQYESIYIQRSWRTATGEAGASTNIPDVIGVRRDGVVDAFEVRSNTQTREQLDTKLAEDMKLLPKKRRGAFEPLEPEPPAP